MYRITILFLILFSLSAKSQNLPDSIVIYKNTYQNQWIEEEKLYEIDKVAIIKRREIKFLYNELNKYDNKQELLNKFGIDTNYILNNTVDLLKFHSGFYRNKIAWNNHQMEFIINELKNIKIYKEELDEYLSKGCCYTMHHSYRNEYVIEIYLNNTIINTFTSRKSVWGYNFPYTDKNNKSVYSYSVDKFLSRKYETKKAKKPIKKRKLLRYLVNEILDSNIQTLYKLSAYSYEEEINELSSDFSIISFEEVYGRGRYIWNEPMTIKITLKSDEMLPNVYLQFLATKDGKSIYSRDTIKNNYKSIVQRIQSINFIIDFIKQNPSTKLDIYYFNNKGINEYNIDKVIKTSERIHCGCNYKFERDYIEQAQFFELNDGNSNSVWFLLPDNKVLLYIMQGEKVLNYNYTDFGEHKGIQYPCVLFDMNGNIIKK